MNETSARGNSAVTALETAAATATAETQIPKARMSSAANRSMSWSCEVASLPISSIE
jgi:hypothetical protein